MAALLIEGDDSLKISVVDRETETINIAMYDKFDGSVNSYLEINISLEEIELIYDWISKQRYELQDLKKGKKEINN